MPKMSRFLVLMSTRQPVFVIKLHPDLDVVENIAQHFFAVEQRLVGIAHFRSVGKEADDLVRPGRIEDGMYPAFRDLVKGVALDKSVAAEHLRKSFQILLHIQSQFGDTPADIGFARSPHDLVGGVVGIQHQQVDGFPLLVTDDPQLGIPQGHVVVEASGGTCVRTAPRARSAAIRYRG